jgi:hypothetical protein
MTELPGTPGFVASRAEKKLSKSRAVAVELMATVALTASLIIAATAVSLGNRSLARGELADSSAAQIPTPAPLKYEAKRSTPGAEQ